MTIEQYRARRTNIITSIQNDYEMLDTWRHKEFLLLEDLDNIDRTIVVCCGFSSVHDMLEDTRKTIERKKKGLSKTEAKIASLEKLENNN